jgi:hypothetical protein
MTHSEAQGSDLAFRAKMGGYGDYVGGFMNIESITDY